MTAKYRRNRSFNIAVSAGIAIMLLLSLLPVDNAHAEGADAIDAMQTIAFAEDNSMISNPERGWYKAYRTSDRWDISRLRSLGVTVVLLKADLKDYKTGPIADIKLQEIRSAFETARKDGLQVMFRAAYDFDGVSKCEPQSLSIITGHIGQLKSIFHDYEDILFCVQAGFLGPWGEWHNSYYGNPPSLEARKAVMNALMDAVPDSRSILVRRPMFIRDMYAGDAGGSSLSLATAFNQSSLSRTGFHNDALLSSEDEDGTYVASGYSRQAELNWVNNHNRFVPFAGESNSLSSYSDPENAIYELNKLHAQILDQVYYPDVIAKWKSTNYGSESTYNYITKHLGYRLIMVDAAINTGISAGGALHLRLRIRNDGFGNLTNARNVEVVLSNGQQTYTAKVNDDPRYWFRENGIMTKDLYFSVPSGIAGGLWSVYLNLPSASATLSKNPLYSVRFANTNTWVQEKGYNLIKSGLTIASGSSSRLVGAFEQITRESAELLIGSASGSPAAVTANPTATPMETPVTPTPDATADASPSPTVSVDPTATQPAPTPEVTESASAEPTVTATTPPAPTATPSIGLETAVSGVTATAASYNSIRVAWSALNGAEKYELYRASSGTGTFSLLASTTSLSYTNRSVSTGVTYYYKVRAYRVADGKKLYSPFSSVVSSAAKPAKPSPVKTAKVSSSRVRVSWVAVAGATKYELWRSASLNGSYSLVSTTGSAYFTNTGLRAGRTYYYKVRAYRIVGSKKVYGAFTPVVSARP